MLLFSEPEELGRELIGVLSVLKKCLHAFCHNLILFAYQSSNKTSVFGTL